MAKRLIGWFATPDDLRRVSADLGARMDLKFVSAISRATPELVIYRAIEEFPHNGHARIHPREPRAHGDPCFVIAPDTEIYQLSELLHVRPGEQVMGWHLDADRMPDAVVMSLPGTNRSERALVDGALMAQSNSPLANTIIKGIRDAIKESHVRRGDGLVGPEAWELAQQGWRTCHNLSQPREYDYDLGLRK